MNFASIDALKDRYQDILKATVQHYIATAEPVGSKTLLEEYNFNISSATIRNIMGKLEKAGFLYQPHTSAGRIPSDSGYRVYVDQLLTFDQQLEHKIEQSLSDKLREESYNLETLLQQSAQILATLTGYIALITLPQAPSHCLRHLQIVQVNPQQLMLVLVTDAYQTRSILIEASHLLSHCQNIEEELQLLSNFMNQKLKGKYLSEINSLNWQELDQEFKHYGEVLKLILNELNRQVSLPRSTPIMIRGISEVLRQPEFSHLNQVQMLLHLLEEEQDQLLPLIFEIPSLTMINPKPKVTIKIGAENPLQPMQSCSLISAIYRQGNIPIGSVGVIGPTRMLYENTILLVSATADYLSETLTA